MAWKNSWIPVNRLLFFIKEDNHKFDLHKISYKFTRIAFIAERVSESFLENFQMQLTVFLFRLRLDLDGGAWVI